MAGPGASTGARIRALREERGMSLSALAAAAGIGKATLSELEGGRRNPTLDTVYAVAGPLGVPLVALVAEAGDSDALSDDALTAVRLHLLTEPDRTTEVYLVRVRPGAERSSPAHAAGAVEQLVVLSGEGRLGRSRWSTWSPARTCTGPPTCRTPTRARRRWSSARST